MIAAAKHVVLHEAMPTQFVALGIAAKRLGVSADHLGRQCKTKYQPIGLAMKHHGRWIVHTKADPRLSDLETWDSRDLRQIGELRAEYVSKRYIEIAETKRNILRDLDRFEPNGPDGDARRRRYINKLAAGGKIPCDGITKLSPRTLRSWLDLYRQSGDAGGIKALVRRRYPERGSTSIGAAAWQFFLHVKHTGTGISVSSAYDQTLGFIIEQGHQERPEWALPALRTVQQNYDARIPLPARVLIDEGPNKFRAKCLPKISRSYDDVPAGHCFCGDERVLDFMARVPGDRGWRRIRPKLTAWLDVRSRMLIGWHIGERANSDTILSSFKAACLAAETAPAEVIIDHGVDYKAVAGPPRSNRKWDSFDAKRVATAFERLEIEAHYAIVRHPWSKMIESHFNAVKNHFDRFMPSFWGGTPNERPFDADKWTNANLHDLMTLEEVRQAFGRFLDAHHEKPQRGDGMDGLSPRQALRQFFTQEPRAVTSDLLELICCRMHGPVKVTRDGVRYQGIIYGKFDHAVWRLQGKEVYVAVDPVEAGHVTLCAEDGAAICRAFADRNRGATQEELRDAISFQRRCEKVAKEYPRSRDYLLKTRPGQIANRQKLAAQARQIPDDQLPTPPKPERIKVVRPDIAASATRVKRAVGAEAMGDPTAPNQTTPGVGAVGRRVVDFAKLQTLETDDEGIQTPPRRVVDYARFAVRSDADDA